jgi:hypothetical protein
MITSIKNFKRIAIFVLAIFMCIFGNNIVALSAINLSSTERNIPYVNNQYLNVNKIAAVPSMDCEPIDEDDEKKDLLANKIVRYMESKGYSISRGKQQRNIVYIEGACADGSANADENDIYNDRRIVFEFVNNEPKILGNWLATTEPGSKYTNNPLNSGGAARVSFGQYKNTYKVGIHEGPSGRGKHEGLKQVGNVTYTRDRNKDGKRTGDPISNGNPFLNQHKGSGNSERRIGGDSAGCLVGWGSSGHVEFMDIIKGDTRYQSNQDYKFTVTLINGDRFAELT